MEAAAEFGLVQAAKAFDPARGIVFTTFAYYRIRGAVFDLLRETAKSNRFQEGANEYMADYVNAAPGTHSYEDIKNVASTIVTSYFLSLDSLRQEIQDKDEAPEDRLMREQRESQIRKALQSLPDSNRRVLEAYYFEDLTLEDIGKKLGLSKSWVSRVHAKGLELLRPIIKKILEDSGKQSPPS